MLCLCRRKHLQSLGLEHWNLSKMPRHKISCWTSKGSHEIGFPWCPALKTHHWTDNAQCLFPLSLCKINGNFHHLKVYRLYQMPQRMQFRTLPLRIGSRKENSLPDARSYRLICHIWDLWTCRMSGLKILGVICSCLKLQKILPIIWHKLMGWNRCDITAHVSKNSVLYKLKDIMPY